MSAIIRGFPPVWREDARVLILGSMPSVESLRQSFYYAHPRNAFWPMLARILNEPEPHSVEEKQAMLLCHSIALWDTVASCEREGSLDGNIRDARANDFEWLYARCLRIHTVLFNGGAAEALYRRLVAKSDARFRFVRLPSSSPAYTLPYEDKLAAWRRAIEEALAYESL